MDYRQRAVPPHNGSDTYVGSAGMACKVDFVVVTVVVKNAVCYVWFAFMHEFIH